MKRLLAVLPAAALALAGCGDTCNSSPAPVDTSALRGGCSTVAAGQSVTISLPICPSCSDTSPTCTGEVRSGNEIHLDSVVQQCSGNTSCGVGCSISPVSCALDKPLSDGVTYTVLYSTQGGAGSTNITAGSGGPSSCTL